MSDRHRLMCPCRACEQTRTTTPDLTRSARQLLLLADHLGVDLEVLETLDSWEWRAEIGTDDTTRLADELEAAESWLVEGNPPDPCETPRQRTVRIIAARRIRESAHA